MRGSTVGRRWQSIAYHETEIEPERIVLNMPPKRSLPANNDPMTATAHRAGKKLLGRALSEKDFPALRRLTATEKFVVLRNGSPLAPGRTPRQPGRSMGPGASLAVQPGRRSRRIAVRGLSYHLVPSFDRRTQVALRSTSVWVRRWQICLYHETYDASPQVSR